MALSRDTDAASASAGKAGGSTLAAGAIAGLAGGAVLLATVMTVAQLAGEPTAKPGVQSDIATVPNAVTSFVFDTGIEQFNSGYSWATYPGVALVLLAGAGLGVLGVALIGALAGLRPPPPVAALMGLVYGLLLHVVLLNGVVDGLQDTDIVSGAAPAWSWWLGHALYGALTGLLGGALLRRLAGRG